MRYKPDVHNRRSVRLKGYDYSKEGLYFVTICTYERECLFGQIVNNEMVLNEYGKAAYECWLQIPAHYPDVVLHPHIIMPNHIHGIIELGPPGSEVGVGVQNFEPLPQTIESLNEAIVPKQHQYQKIIPRSVGAIVRGYKIGVTKWVRSNTDIYKVWQRNFHEHIIRNENEYQKIEQYIFENPARWEEDKFYR